MSSGFKVSLKVGQESAYGVPAGNMVRMPIVRPGIKGSQNLIKSRALLDDVNPRKPVSGNRSVAGPIETECSPLSFGWWLKWLTGAVSTQAVGTGTGYLINNGAGYPVGTVTMTLDTGTGTIPVNSWISIGGVVYRINASAGAPVTSITIDGGLTAAVADNAAVTLPAGTYGHRFDLTNATMQSLFAEIAFADVNRFHFFKGLYLDRVSFRLSSEGLMSVGVDVEGKDVSFHAATQNPGSVVTPAHSAFSYFGCRVYANGAAVGVVKNLDFTISRELDKAQYVMDGSGTRAEIPAGIAMVEGTMKVIYQDDTYTTLADAGTETSIRAIIRDGTSAAGLFFPEVRLQLNTPEVVSESVVEQDIPFQAYYEDSTQATAFQATILNTQASYASI